MKTNFWAGVENATLVRDARLFATAAHAAVAQLRKYTNEPYIVHPIEVASIVATVPHTPEQLAAAYLHDVLEDTQVTEPVLRELFGDRVTDLVVWLTNVSKLSDGKRSVRKELDRQKLAKAPAEAQTVKLADLISNTGSIVAYDPEFAKTYIPEKRDLLEVLTRGDRTLLARAHAQLKESGF